MTCLQHSFKKIFNFAWQNKKKCSTLWKTRMKSLLVSKAAQKCHNWHGKVYKNCLFFSNYCGKSRNLTTVKKMNADLVGAYHSKVKLRRKIACKLWLKICSLLSCTTIRNGGQIYILCSICSCTKISATHTKTVEITSDKNRKYSEKFNHI